MKLTNLETYNAYKVFAAKNSKLTYKKIRTETRYDNKTTGPLVIETRY